MTTKPLSCPACGDEFSGHDLVATEIEGSTLTLPDDKAVPRPGSILVCFNCGDISVVADSGLAVPLSEEEAQTLSPNVIGFLAEMENSRKAIMRQAGRNPFGRDLK